MEDKSTTSQGKLHIVSWNIRGILDKAKRGAVIRQAKHLGADVLMLQEMHLMGTKTPCLSLFGYDLVYHSGFVRGSRGTLLLIHHRVPF